VRVAQQYVARKETDQSFEWVAVIVDRGEDFATPTSYAERSAKT
jgi:hypothetical protein